MVNLPENITANLQNGINSDEEVAANPNLIPNTSNQTTTSPPIAQIPNPIPQNVPPQTSREASKITGTVKWFNAKHGYGFITRHDTGEDVFVHCTGIMRKNPRHFMKSLGDGEIVEFNTMAVNVTGPRGAHVRGNPYVSYIPVRQDFLAAGDPGIMPSLRRFNQIPPNYGNSRIPRWSLYRNTNF